jgi:hypothetical protein
LVDKGTLTFTFYVLDNAKQDFYQPTGGTLAHGTASIGTPKTGTVTFAVPPGDFTLYLSTAAGKPITALIVKG